MFFAPPFFSFSSLRKKRIAAASEEASSIPFPPGRRKLHIRSLLLPSQIVTVSLGHNLAIWNFTTPHAILMMAVISLPANTAKSKTSMRRKSRARLWSIEGVRGNHPKGFPGRLFPFLIGTERRPSTAVGFREGRRRLRMWRFRRPGESGTEQPSSDADTVLFFLRIEKEKNGVAKPRSLYIFRRVCYNKTSF